jgi:hypothetical protein
MIIDIGLLTSKDILMKGCGMKVESPVKILCTGFAPDL